MMGRRLSTRREYHVVAGPPCNIPKVKGEKEHMVYLFKNEATLYKTCVTWDNDDGSRQHDMEVIACGPRKEIEKIYRLLLEAEESGKKEKKIPSTE